MKTFLSLVIYFLSDLNDFLSCVDELTAGGKNTLHDHLSKSFFSSVKTLQIARGVKKKLKVFYV